jgi:hypothetical protein
MTQQPGRLDQLALNILAHVVRTHGAPFWVGIWDNGGAALIEYGIARLIPTQPVQSVQVGQMQIPLDLLSAFARAAKLLPEGPRA